MRIITILCGYTIPRMQYTFTVWILYNINHVLLEPKKDYFRKYSTTVNMNTLIFSYKLNDTYRITDLNKFINLNMLQFIAHNKSKVQRQIISVY